MDELLQETIKIKRHIRTQRTFIYCGFFCLGICFSNILCGNEILIQIAGIILNILMIFSADSEIKKNSLMMYKIYHKSNGTS
jgi:hypothetical protein